MRTVCILAAVLAVAAQAGEAPSPPSAPSAKPAYEPTSHYRLQDIEGWPVYVHQRLVEGDRKAIGDETLKLLRSKLLDANRRFPKEALGDLHKVKIWLEADSKDVVAACYHPSRGWLEEHGFNPEKAKSIEIGRPENFLAWEDHQPAMMIHELAHAYHHQVLGYDQPDIKAAFQRAVEGKSYESVLRFDGRPGRHYALNNDQEYFAETTEAYFATNDFYPFVRAELEQHDPEMVKVLRKVWIERWKTPETPKP
ncbi:MAG: hypothetical protein IMZ66_08370 [Planctomycetes bacterium]|nr:hypothetical protein [Planctomycetota bacterium]